MEKTKQQIIKEYVGDIWNADHPARQAAIKIIEKVIEPLLNKGIEGEEYYDLEDQITKIVANV